MAFSYLAKCMVIINIFPRKQGTLLKKHEKTIKYKKVFKTEYKHTSPEKDCTNSKMKVDRQHFLPSRYHIGHNHYLSPCNSLL